MNYLTAVHTDVGIRKRVNQDSVLIETAATDYGQIMFGVVCDGMGGLAKGEVASALLVKAFSEWFHKEFPRILYEGMDVDILRDSWINLIFAQNGKISCYGRNCGVSMGTTVVALLLVKNNYYVINVGDSRVYYLKDGIHQITTDQTVVQREKDLGRLTLEEAKVHPRRNVLLQCVGASSIIKPDFHVGEYERDSVFMICSDGFWHMIEPWEFAEKIRTTDMVTEEKLKETAVYFTELSKVRREDDNISVALIRAY